MSIELSIGPVGSGKTSSFITDIVSQLKKGAAASLIVPTESQAKLIRREILSGNKTHSPLGFVLPNDAVITWSKFIISFAGQNRLTIARYQATLLTFKILKELSVQKRLSYFADIPPSPDLARHFFNAIHELKKNGVTPSSLRKIHQGSIDRIADLTKVYEAYEERLQKNAWQDEADIVRDAIAGSESRLATKDATLYIDGFVHIPPHIYEMLSALKDKVSSIKIAYPTFNDRIPRLCSEPALRLCSGPARSDVFARNATRLTELADDVVELTSPLSPACNALHSMAGRPSPSKDGGFPSPTEGRGRLMRETHFTDNKHSPVDIKVFSARSPIQEARAVLNLLGEFIGRSSIVIAPRGGSRFLEYLTTEIQTADIPITLRETSTGLAPIIHTLLSTPSMEKLPHKATITEFCEALSSSISEELLKSYIHALHTESKFLRAASHNISAAFALRSTLQNLATTSILINTDMVTLNDFLSLVYSELGPPEYSIEQLDETASIINVPFENGLSTPTDVVVLPQMNEGVTPNIAREDMFFGEESGELSDIFLNSFDLLAIERFNFSQFAAKCRTNLFVTYSISGESSRELWPSPFIEQFGLKSLTEAHPSLLPYRARTDKCLQSSIKERIRIDFERVAHTTSQPEYHGIIKDNHALSLVEANYGDNPIDVTSLEIYAKCPFQFFVNYVLGIREPDEPSPEVIAKDQGSVIHMALKEFFQNYRNIFISAVNGEDIKLAKVVDEILDGVFRQLGKKIEKAKECMVPFARKAIKLMLVRVIDLEINEARSIARPLLNRTCEWSFGNGVTPPVKIESTDTSPVYIKGRVDRIDADDTNSHFFVVDYKKGKTDAVVGKIKEGLHLQLPLYIEAIRKNLLKSAKPLGGLLFSTSTLDKKHGLVLGDERANGVYFSKLSKKLDATLSEEGFFECIDIATQYAAKYIADIRHGIFDTELGKDCTEYCPYGDICRKKI